MAKPQIANIKPADLENLNIKTLNLKPLHLNVSSQSLISDSNL
jgi:hypothetical protein